MLFRTTVYIHDLGGGLEPEAYCIQYGWHRGTTIATGDDPDVVEIQRVFDNSGRDCLDELGPALRFLMEEDIYLKERADYLMGKN